MGALHGLNPAAGWIFATASGLRSGDRLRALRALVPIGAGHVTSITLVAGTLVSGSSMNRFAMQAVAGGLLIAVVACHFLLHRTKASAVAGHAGLALGSFLVSTVHGTGSMLVPGMFALCTAGSSPGVATASGSMPTALAAIGVHTAAMLAVTGAMAAGLCRAAQFVAGWARIPVRAGMTSGYGRAGRTPIL